MKIVVALLFTALATPAAAQQAGVVNTPTAGQTASAPAAHPPPTVVIAVPQGVIVSLDQTGRASPPASFESQPVGTSAYVGEIPAVSGMYEPPSPAMRRYEESDEPYRPNNAHGITLILPPGPFHQPPDVAVPPKALRPATSYLTRADQPRELNGMVRPDVRLLLIINLAGRVRECGIARTSGSVALDWTSCHVMTMRARFTPATDVDGHPVIGNIVQELKWKLPPAASKRFRKLDAVAGAAIIQPPRPLLPVQAYFKPSDYPAAALAARAEGRVQVTLTIASNGLVQSCGFSGNDGFTVLRQASCEVLQSRARFTPAIDSHGNSAPGVVEQVVEWKLPARLPGPNPYAGLPVMNSIEPPPPEIMARDGEWHEPYRPGQAKAITFIATRPDEREPAGVLRPPSETRSSQSYLRPTDYPHSPLARKLHATVRMLLHVGPTGLVTGCGILRTSGSRWLDSASCLVLTKRARFRPATNLDGEAVTGDLVQELEWKRP